MFDIGFSELFVIALVALLVLGPERLPKAARFAGLWVRRARAQWYSVKSELENELADDELKRSLQQTRDQLHEEMRQARDELQQGSLALRREFDRDNIPPASMHAPAVTSPAPDRVDGIASQPGEPDLPPAHDDDDRR
jgi:sec-independent protein translocase protein TatB